jgi:hypothetical protein
MSQQGRIFFIDPPSSCVIPDQFDLRFERHIGKGFIATHITRKADDLRHVYATLFKRYEFPIVAAELRPARETCELCHNAEKCSDDSLRELKRFGTDKKHPLLEQRLPWQCLGKCRL